MKKKTKKIFLYVLIICTLIIVALIPFPAELNRQNKEHLVEHALSALLNDKRILTNRGCRYQQLAECHFMKNKNLYFRNRLGIPDSVFIKYGLKPIPKDKKNNVDREDAVVSFVCLERNGNELNRVSFSYVFGSLGAHGYEIKVYRCLLFRYFIYIHKWIS